MNEAETRAEHIDPALKPQLGRGRGSRILREYPITLGRMKDSDGAVKH